MKKLQAPLLLSFAALTGANAPTADVAPPQPSPVLPIPSVKYEGIQIAFQLAATPDNTVYMVPRPGALLKLTDSDKTEKSIVFDCDSLKGLSSHLTHILALSGRLAALTSSAPLVDPDIVRASLNEVSRAQVELNCKIIIA